MKAVLLCGSIAEHSHTRALLEQLKNCLEERKVATELWDLKTNPLPIADPNYHRESDIHPDPIVQEFVALIKSASCYALATPLYHGSFSGVLKNALDTLWYDSFRNKPVALLSHGASDRRCAQPAVALQQVVTTMFGYPLQTQVASAKVDFDYDGGQPRLISSSVKERIERQADELVALNELFSRLKH
jgi:azobenzene reductase